MFSFVISGKNHVHFILAQLFSKRNHTCRRAYDSAFVALVNKCAYAFALSILCAALAFASTSAAASAAPTASPPATTVAAVIATPWPPPISITSRYSAAAPHGHSVGSRPDRDAWWCLTGDHRPSPETTCRDFPPLAPSTLPAGKPASPKIVVIGVRAVAHGVRVAAAAPEEEEVVSPLTGRDSACRCSVSVREEGVGGDAGVSLAEGGVVINASSFGETPEVRRGTIPLLTVLAVLPPA